MESKKGSLRHPRRLRSEMLEERQMLSVNFIRSDLDFILQQTKIAEAHAAGADLTNLIPNNELAFGLRTVDGSFNNLFQGQTEFGAADNAFLRLLDPVFRDAESFDPDGPGPAPAAPTSYTQTSGIVVDSEPRTISNLIVDQTENNPAAVAAAAAVGGELVTGTRADGTPFQTFFIPNVMPDGGLTVPFNSAMTFFGQFFDHGLDLVTKGGSGTVFIPLQPDDPLFDAGVDGIPNTADDGPNFMVLTRATNLPGDDGVLGTADDIHEQTNTTSPFVDQNQTYSSHPSHQVFLRAYEFNTVGDPVATGKLVVNGNLGADGEFGTADDVVIGGMATWATVKAQARDLLGIQLTDADVFGVPLLATDPYGNFRKGPNGFPQVVMPGPDGVANTADDVLVEGNPAAPISVAGSVKTGHAFLDDIAHTAVPSAGLAPDADAVAGGPVAPGFYDNELLDAHYIAGDGRVNENIGLTTIHHVFHSEHNRLVDHVKDVILQSGDVAFLNQWLVNPVAGIPADPSALAWNGERLFQAAKFGTEMQYQHLVFEEFARTIQPNIDIFIDYDVTIDPSITAEFAHTVYRFGHSMLTETIDRMDPAFASSEIGLIQAFLNPLEFAASGLTPDEAAGAIVRGVTRQVGNGIDEFVTEALRNNLLGLPLDLPAINLARGRDTGIPSLNAARRTFYAGTSDSLLAPYASWSDFVQHLKHPESLVNFIAAYGTHPTVASATTLADKRAAATLLVLGGAGEPADRLDFLNSTGAWASAPNGVTATGLDDVDFWVGGLAEKIMPFGGMLGSTFNFVFETQLEALQNGDRFYYLHRTVGLNFLSELENNSFAKLIMANTDATHLPGLVFLTPALTLEVDQTRQFNAGVANNPGPDGILFDDPLTPVDESADNIATPREDPLGPGPIPLVLRDSPATPGPDANYLQYTGGETVVLGGTPGNDVLIAGASDDDTVYGDAGNDRIEGGFGNDDLNGGDGDDIITDIGGDDVIHGDAGNDVIHGGNGLNLIIAGPGHDFIITGEDSSEVIAGPGNDFILGAPLNIQMTGNEGDDWIEVGTQDGAPGDNFDPLGLDPIAGHDVFLGNGQFDEMIGEGGDDIMVGSGGPDKMKGMSGFDWATFKNETMGVNVDLFGDLLFETPLPASTTGVGTRFFQMEGLSGSAFSDILRGDEADANMIRAAGATGSVLTNIAIVNGLQQFLGAGVTFFGSGNIILGGAGSDIIEGRGGDDLIDGDRWLNVRISVRQNRDGTGPEIRSANSLTELQADVLNGTINPGQLVIVREILTAPSPDFDTAVFSDVRANYTITTVNGVTTVTHVIPPPAGGGGGGGLINFSDGTDRLTNIERLQFADQTIVLVPNLNEEPVGQAAILDAVNAPESTPVVGQLLRASVANVTDQDNSGGEAVTGPVTYIWQFERIPGSGRFDDISVGLAPRAAPSAIGPSFTVTPNLEGFALRVKAHYQDANGVMETVFSAPTAAVAAGTPAPARSPLLTDEQPGVVSTGVHFLGSDLQFILDQIKISEAHAAGADLIALLPNIRVAQGLRTVDGSLNNLVQGQTEFGAADNTFPRLLTPVFGPAEAGTSYLQTGGTVVDSEPRTISNLIVDQTANNPAAVAAAASVGGELVNGTRTDGAPFETYFIPNVMPDGGLTVPFNAWMTFFGQFFDHGLDLVTKGGSGTVFMPLKPDDPLFVPGSPTNFMVLTRATNLPGPDGVLGTADDIHEQSNTTSPFVDQNQTYASHPSHQVFLRAYELNAAGDPVATGKLIVNRSLGPDGEFGTAADAAIGGMATWATVKAQTRDLLGIQLTDSDVFNVPLLATDPYGNFLPGPNGFVQLVTTTGLVEGDPAANGGNGVAIPANAIRTGHAFLDDIAHTAVPTAGLAPDADAVAGGPVAAGFYDNELLEAHFIAGDGRVNENIGLTTVHHVFHSEHNRLVDHTKDVALATVVGGNVSFLNEWLLAPVAAVPADLTTLAWNGERLFQAAKFGTEMQYQHLVFEEFARTIQPQIDLFIPRFQNYDVTIDPSIVAEFAHTVYRFGHSMLTETIDRRDPTFASSEIGLIQAFLNPLEFAASGPTPDEAAGAIVRGVTRQVGNGIDEFVTEALRNNLVGLPLDLPAINIARGRDVGIPSLNAARRQFYAMTADSQLTPYTSWADFAAHLKHPESLVNFIAAYGRHGSITSATTLAGKRAAATLLVLGGAGEPADRLAFLNSTGAWASNANGVTTTGLDDVDFWIGGLAEKIMPFGGMLGPTFNFVFETQLENLQNGDRFYYLERTSGLNFLTELENNSFAKLIMANTDATHLPGLVFLTPAFTLEVDQTRQFNPSVIPGPDGILGTADDLPANADPVGDSILTPLVIRDDPATPGADTNYVQYTGGETVVMGGTPGDDILIAGASDDDTLYGDAGNDRLEGGFGNDTIRGGIGDDIITDIGGDDVFHGEDGNDVIHGGNGINLILGGFGKDFIVTGPDASEAFGGPGNDFILGANTNEQDMGNEGDDWLEGGLLDGSPGDNFDGFGLDLIVGNDVFLGSGSPDIMIGEGGDDIFIGSSGPGDKYLGHSGFDWATFKNDATGVEIDLNLRVLDAGPVPAAAAILARFAQVEGLSGSPFGDILRGDNADAAMIATAGAQGSVLRNIALIAGLQDFLGAGVTSFGAGNIILGGDGSDIIIGDSNSNGGGALGGDDLIDGDKWLNVRISVRQNVDGTGPEIASFDSMEPLVPFMLDGTYSPGQLVIVREILSGNGGFDTAVFAGPLDTNYNISIDDNGTPGDPTDDVVTVTDVVGNEGSDRLTNIERLLFADQTIVLVPGLNNEPQGLLTVSDFTPSVGNVLTVSAALVSDADGLGPMSFVWQVETAPGSGIFQDIQTATGAGVQRALGPTFTVPVNLVGLSIRAQAVYQDGHGVLEIVNSAPTAPVASGRPVVTLAIADRVIAEDAAPVVINVANVFSDPDLALGDVLTLSALSGNAALVSASLAGTQLTLTVAPNANGSALVSVTATDLSGLSITDQFIVTVIPVNDAPSLNAIANPAAISEDAGLQTVGFSGIGPGGGADEAGQTFTVTATSSNPSLIPNPVVSYASPSATGTLSFTPVANANGAATITVTVIDNGGTANGGVNSFSQTFTVTVNPVNDAPTVAQAAADVTANEDAAPVVVNLNTVFADVDIVPNADQLAFTVLNSNPGLVGTSVAEGQLTLTFSANASGSANISVTARDVAGLAITDAFTVTVNPVNDAPTFTRGVNLSVPEDSGPRTVAGWATAISPGPADEAGQTVAFVVTSDNPALFSAAPAISPAGTLTFTPAANANGTATVSVQLEDNGGTANGGVNLSAVQTFVIAVTAVNDAPSFAAANPPAINQGAGPQSIPGWVASVAMGPPNEASQSVLAYVVSAVSNPAFFAAAPAVAADGTLSYTPAPGARGTATFAVAVRDDGGTANGGADTSATQTFTILVNPVVQLPGGAGTNNAVVLRVGANLRVVNNGNLLLNAPLASFTGLTILGAANKTDTVTVIPAAGGGLTLAQGITFDGGDGAGNDVLRVQGTGGADTLAVRSQTAPTSSDLVAFQNGANAISVQFTGTELVQLVGQGGNDTYAIDALPANVTVIDAGGSDTLDFSRAASGVAVNLGSAARQAVFGGATGLALQATPIENVIGTPLSDTITGNARVNRITGGDGDDVINAGGGTDLIFGGLGNDTLNGGTGNDVLSGGDGDDILRVGGGRNVLIGGLGADDVRGNAGRDLLIGGNTAFDDNQAALLAILTEWSSNRTINQRVARLTQGLGPSRTPFLRPGESVLDDGAADTLFGGLEGDWFLSFPGDNVLDRGAADR